MYKVNAIDKLSFILILAGALNWGLIGLLNYNLIGTLVFNSVLLQRVAYILIFLSAIDILYVIMKLKSLKLFN